MLQTILSLYVYARISDDTLARVRSWSPCTNNPLDPGARIDEADGAQDLVLLALSPSPSARRDDSVGSQVLHAVGSLYCGSRLRLEPPTYNSFWSFKVQKVAKREGSEGWGVKTARGEAQMR